MSRLLLDDTNAGGLYLRLKEDGDTCYVMPIFDPEDEGDGVFYYGQHWPPKDAPKGPPIPCLRPEPCPMCEEGRRADFRMAMTVYDVETKTRRILDGFPAMWMRDLKEVLEDWDWTKVRLKIKRTGKLAQTRRTIVPLPAGEDEVIAAKMTKPFSIEELMAKVGPTAERSGSGHRDDPGPDMNDPLADADDDNVPF